MTMKDGGIKTDEAKNGAAEPAKRRRLPLPRAFLLAAAASLALSSVFFALASSAGRGLYDQRAAERWSRPAAKPEGTAGQGAAEDGAETPAGDAEAGAEGSLKSSEMGYSQVSAFMARGAGLSYIDMMRLRQGIADKYTADGITPPEEDARLWIDAASGTGTSSASAGGEATPVSVSVTGILGDFFFFHPAKLLSGQYINTNEASKDYVMLDWNTSWRVFGGHDAAGMRVEIGGIPCVVVGVFEKDEGDEAENKVYASFELLEKLVPSAELTALDFVLSAPITGYGTQAVEGLLTAVPAGERVVVENSARFALGSLLGTIGDIGGLAAKTNAVALPYWENAARAAALRGAAFLLLAMIFAALPLITAIILLVKLYGRRGRFPPWAVRTFKAIRARAAGAGPPAEPPTPEEP